MEVITRKYYADIVDSRIGKGQYHRHCRFAPCGEKYVVKDFIQRHKDDTDANIKLYHNN